MSRHGIVRDVEFAHVDARKTSLPHCNCSIGGGELFDRVIEEEFVLTERACACFVKQILQGVSYMHGRQIVHLDLKVGTERGSGKS